MLVTDNTLSVHIRQLRNAQGLRGERIETHVGEGYRFNDA
ncbi:MAG: winged helix-turn-helix domain-containing protein [Elusimicrobia bacterium]|nr:winged helix-turn-helix domain-containing protein [Elusimicrobiota bacterium]